MIIYSSWFRPRHANDLEIKLRCLLLFSDAQQFLGAGGVRLWLAMFGLYAAPGLVLSIGTTVCLALRMSRRQDALSCELCLSVVVAPELRHTLLGISTRVRSLNWKYGMCGSVGYDRKIAPAVQLAPTCQSSLKPSQSCVSQKTRWYSDTTSLSMHTL